jgi:hypothetical protein
MNISKSVLEWREGDEITIEHRNALAADMARCFNLSPQKEEETRQDYARASERAVADALAVMIAQHLRMSADVFRQNFPTISRDSKSFAVQQVLMLADRLAACPDNSPDLGQIG